jgi:hypothetical protein
MAISLHGMGTWSHLRMYVINMLLFYFFFALAIPRMLIQPTYSVFPCNHVTRKAF